ncbi:hypothetical protein A462_02090, partial [Pseudomonas sp. Ag1]
QNARVIVNDLREQARSHIWTVPALAFDFALQHSSRPVGRCALDLLLILILGTPSLSEEPSGGARAFCLLLTGPAFRLFKSEPL